jgi:glycosyltransferase involved in cell wall biosynthesis
MGNANVRQAMLAFAEENLLEFFLTSIAVFDRSLLSSLSRLPGLQELSRRHFPSEIRPFTKSYPAREIVRLLLSRMGFPHWISHETGWASVDQIFRALDRELSKKIARGKMRAVYCYEDGALASFQEAKKRGLKCLYDYPVAHWRKVRSIMEEEGQLHPEWVATMPGFKDSQKKLDRKDEELRLADRIFVASEFSRSTLESYPFPLAPIIVNPYGAPAPNLAYVKAPRRANSSATLKILFVGGLHQMKGISYLLQAKKLIGKSVTLTLIGALLTKGCAPLNEALSSNLWISTMPQNKILEQMRAHDVFVFPSLSEGFGMVVTEALSQGLPVITTPNTCGPDVISEGVDGFIVPIRNPEAIAEKIEILNLNRDRLATMSLAAEAKARQLTWASYRARLISDIKTHTLL